MTAPAPVSTKTPLQRAKDAQQARTSNEVLKLTYQIMQDNHWADGQGWTGPLPKFDGSADGARNVARVTEEIRRQFVSRNLVDNVVGRHVWGIAGREPLIGIRPRRRVKDGQKPTVKEQGFIDEYWDAFTDWWDNSGVWLAIQQALRNAVWSGAGTLRLFVPRSKLRQVGRTVEGQPVMGVPGGLKLAEAMGFISVHAPEWDKAGIVRDSEGRVTSAYYRYTNEQDQERWELQERRTEGEVRGTLVTPAATGQDTDPADFYPLPDLMLFEINLKPLVTESIRRLSQFGNKIMTMGSRNIDLGGFIERTILNAQMPGEWVEDKTALDGRRFVPSTYNVGAGVTNFLNGTAVFTHDEATGQMIPTGNFATPNIVYKDPVQWATFGETFAAVREAVFDEARQLHVLIAGDAMANGISRVQAVQDFITSLEPTRMALEQLLRWLISTVVSLALHFTNRRAEWEDFKATAQARISAVQPTPEQIKTANEMRDARRISYKTWCALVGIEESEAELTGLASEPITQDVALVLLEKAPTWVGLKALSLAFPALGISEEDITMQREADLGGPPPVQGDQGEGDEEETEEEQGAA
ncbi:hypothetical protein [Deinococcus multiflagellatus]|uniref:Portal protein n=1 Tax=Deinococcus multiflagellatus TaxID=1656887 RepID=A0ABW1ZES0_9DEIO|nr:hypothetical protein [Deinococcus multiflagellatus]MBZ9712194.1 hypothetical protein [Deinococcus multiflagellatus]